MNVISKILSSFFVLIFLGTIQNIFALTKDNNESFKNQQKSTVYFQENKGQVHDQNYKPRTDILYSGNNGNMAFYLKNNGMHYQLQRIDEWKREVIDSLRDTTTIKVPSKYTIQRLDISWLGSNPNPEIVAQKTISGFDNFYLPSCPNGALGVKSYEEVTYKNIYEGIDLIFHNKDNSLNYDFKVKPGVDYHQIKIDIKGADKISLTQQGDVNISTPLGKIIEGKPIVYQNGKELKANWVLENNQLSFSIENVDASLELLIDPLVRKWGTYYGGSYSESIYDDNFGDCEIDNFGDIYLTSHTQSPSNIATSGAYQTTISYNSIGSPSLETYLVKFDSNGNRLWGTYFGGTGPDYVSDCTIDFQGNVYICGRTTSPSLATVGAHQTTAKGEDAFLAKFNSIGNLIWCTYYGGNSIESGDGCTTDKFGNVYLSGSTSDQNMIPNIISSPGSHQPNPGNVSLWDAFLVKFDSSGTRLWGTYYGGENNDSGRKCSTDTSGNVFLTGESASYSQIATTGSHQPMKNGGYDGFLVKFNSNGIRQWGTYYGGGNYERLKDCRIDNLGNIILVGHTESTTSIATVGSYKPSPIGYYDAFLIKFDNNGNRLWGTYFGGVGDDYGLSARINKHGDIYLAGSNFAYGGLGTDTISTLNAYQISSGGSYDGFLAKFDENGNIYFATYYGGTFDDRAFSCAISDNGYVYLAGNTWSSNNIASANGFQPTISGGTDNFLVQFCDTTPEMPVAIYGPQIVCFGDENVLFYTENSLNNYFWSVPTGSMITSGQGTDSVFVNFGNNSGNITVAAQNNCGSSVPQVISITVNTIKPNVVIIPLTDTLCFGENIQITASGGDSYLWNTGDTTNIIVVSPMIDTSYVVTVSENGCDSISPPISIYVKPNYFLSDSSYICEGDSMLIFGNYQSVSGIYYDSLQTIFGCDSILEFKLSKINKIMDSLNLNICDGDSLYLQGTYQFVNGLYFDTLQSIFGCDSIVVSNLNIVQTTYANVDQSICIGDSILLGGNYQNSAGVYYDTLSGILSCDSILITNLQIKPKPSVPIGNDTIVCYNDGIPDLNISNSSGGNIEWYNDVNGINLIQTGNTFTPSINQEGIYNFYIKEILNGCYSDVFTLTIQVNKPMATINPSTTSGFIPLEIQFGNGSLNAVTYLWDFGNGDTSNIFEPKYIYLTTNLYTVSLTATDTLGCFDKTTVTILVDEKIIVSVPNTITPNGDGANDYWVIGNIEKFPNNEVEIFNRNGSSIFKSTNYNNNWNGQYNGQDLPATTYYYVIDLGSKILKGDLSIIRE